MLQTLPAVMFGQNIMIWELRVSKLLQIINVYTSDSLLDVLRYVARKMMERGSRHFSYGIADDLDDPKYQHYRYWSNPLETK